MKSRSQNLLLTKWHLNFENIFISWKINNLSGWPIFLNWKILLFQVIYRFREEFVCNFQSVYTIWIPIWRMLISKFAFWCICSMRDDSFWKDFNLTSNLWNWMLRSYRWILYNILIIIFNRFLCIVLEKKIKIQIVCWQLLSMYCIYRTILSNICKCFWFFR